MNSELEKLLGSTDAAIRRAYALGRKDALDQLVQYARSDDGAPPLALPSPEPTLAHEAPAAEPLAPLVANDDGAASGGYGSSRAYDATPKRPNGGITGMILDFVYPPKAG